MVKTFLSNTSISNHILLRALCQNVFKMGEGYGEGQDKKTMFAEAKLLMFPDISEKSTRGQN